jgi:hypothetical protein
MKYLVAFSALAALTAGKEIPKDPVRAAALYDSGVLHERIMAEKERGWAANAVKFNRAGGPQYPELHFAQCRDGKAVPFRDEKDNFYRCNNVGNFSLNIQPKH